MTTIFIGLAILLMLVLLGDWAIDEWKRHRRRKAIFEDRTLGARAVLDDIPHRQRED